MSPTVVLLQPQDPGSHRRCSGQHGLFSCHSLRIDLCSEVDFVQVTCPSMVHTWLSPTGHILNFLRLASLCTLAHLLVLNHLFDSQQRTERYRFSIYRKIKLLIPVIFTLQKSIAHVSSMRILKFKNQIKIAKSNRYEAVNKTLVKKIQ